MGRPIKPFSVWSRKVIFLLFVAILQANNTCFGLRTSNSPSSVYREKQKQSKSEKTKKSTKMDRAGKLRASEINGTSADQLPTTEEQSAKSKSVWDKLKAKCNAVWDRFKQLPKSKQKEEMIKDVFSLCKEALVEFNKLTESEQQEKKSELDALYKKSLTEFNRLSKSDQEDVIKELSKLEAAYFLKYVMKKGDLKFFSLLCKNRTFTYSDLLGALSQVTSLELDKLSEAVYTIFNTLFRALLEHPYFSSNDLCSQDKQTGRMLLHCVAILCGNKDIWKMVLNKIHADDLCIQDNGGRTPLHLFAYYKRIEDDSLNLTFIRIRDKLNENKVDYDKIIDQFIAQKDNDGYTVISCSWLPEGRNASYLTLNELVRRPSKEVKMFNCILSYLPRCLDQDQLVTIECDIKVKVDDGTISKQYANTLYAIVEDYIKKEYVFDYKHIIKYVTDRRNGMLIAEPVKNIIHEKKSSYHGPNYSDYADIPYIDEDDEQTPA